MGAESDAVGFVNGGGLAGGDPGVFPVHAVFEPDRAGLAGGTGVGLGLERMGWERDRQIDVGVGDDLEEGCDHALLVRDLDAIFLSGAMDWR